MDNITNSVINYLISLHFLIIKQLKWRFFINKTRSPQNVQSQALLNILKDNNNTLFGKEYSFSSVSTYEDYKNSVPVHTYEMLRRYIDDQRIYGNPILTKDKPLMYARTSGTTDKPKLIPVLSKTVSDYKMSQSISNFAQYRVCPSMFDGKILAVTSGAKEGMLDSVVTFGSVSGLVYKSIPIAIRRKYLIPYEVFELENYDEKYFVISALSVAEHNVSTIAAVNPTTILKILEVINNRFYNIIRILEEGSVSHLENMSENAMRLLRENIKTDPKRAHDLKHIYSNNKALLFKDLWPGIKAVVTWTQGNCSVSIQRLKSQLNENTRIFELGYFSSEFRGTIVLDSNSVSGVPVLDKNFYEFIEVDDWDSGNYEYRTLESVEPGKHYYIVVTTPYGLYRYFINDIVEITGKFNKTPEIRFVQKGKGITNLTGEKLCEYQVTRALNCVSSNLGLDINFFIFLAIPNDMIYRLYLESKPYDTSELARSIDEELKNINIEYKSKRESGRLDIPDIEFVSEGTGEQYKKHCIRNGQRDAQFKFNHLMYMNDCTYNFINNRIN